MKSFLSSLSAILLCGCAAAATVPDTQVEFLPEVDAYININSTMRLGLLSKFQSHQEGDTWNGDFGVHLDWALKPVFRRELRQGDDVFSKRFLACGAGFRYISGLTGDSSYLEHRWIAECTPRFPLPGQLILSDRNRGEMRFINRQQFSTRYRNRLQLERDFSIGHLVYTPYVNDEVFYDTRHDSWNRNRYSAGVQVPAGAHAVIDVYYYRQNQSRSAPPHVNALGLRLLFYF
jgi:Protein of unknown function (DUF2490)